MVGGGGEDISFTCISGISKEKVCLKESEKWAGVGRGSLENEPKRFCSNVRFMRKLFLQASSST